MNKYSRKLVLDYINGNDIPDYDIKSLENDIEFMQQVIEISNNKDMYECCSDELKNNYEFVFYLINKFKRDSKFISELCIQFINNEKENYLQRVELAIMTTEILEKKHNIMASEIKLFVNEIYENILENVMTTIEELEKVDDYDYGLGFVFINDLFANSKITLDYFAKGYMDEIFFNKLYGFEKVLHKNFKKYDDIEKYGINRFLINYTNSYDTYLAMYVSCNIELFESIKREMVAIKRNWNYYEEIKDHVKLEVYIDEVEKFINSRELVTSFTVNDLIRYNASKFGFEKLLLEHPSYSEIFKDANKNIFVNKKTLNYDDMLCLKYSKDLAIQIFENDEIILEREVVEEDKKEPKIIKMPTKKN